MSMKKVFESSQIDFGSGKLLFSWHPRTSHMALAGSNGKVTILGPELSRTRSFSLHDILDIDWDYQTDTLAILSGGIGSIVLASASAAGLDTMDTTVNGLTILRWSQYESFLAAGALNGSLMIYDKSEKKKIPIAGTHSARVIGIQWTQDGNLVSVGEDNLLVVTNKKGDMVSRVNLSHTPQLFSMIEEGSSKGEAYSIAFVASQTHIQRIDTTTGSIVNFELNADNSTITSIEVINSHMLVFGLSTGRMSLVQTKDKEMVICQSLDVSRDGIKGLTYCRDNGLLVASGDKRLRVFGLTNGDLGEFKSDLINLDDPVGNDSSLKWSRDGKFLGFASSEGRVTIFSGKLKKVSACFSNYIFYYMGSRTIAVKDLRDTSATVTSFSIDIDADIMAVANDVMVLAVGRRVSIYEYKMVTNSSDSGASQLQKSPKEIRTFDHNVAITDIKTSSKFLAILADGKLSVYPVQDEAIAPTTFPEAGSNPLIAIGITESLLMYVTMDRVVVVSFPSMQVVAEYTSNSRIRRAFPNPSCTRVAYIDERNSMFVLNPITQMTSQAEGFEASHKWLLWDHGESCVFITHDGSKAVTFVCSPYSRHGATCESILVRDHASDNLYTPLKFEGHPVCLYRGTVCAQSQRGSIETLLLQSHNETSSRSPSAEAFYNNFCLNRLRWASQNISTPQEAEDLAVKALHMLDIDLAIRVYRQLSQPSLVLCLEKIKHIHEKNLLIGNVSMIMGYFKDAQNFFLRSSRPLCALEMRRDLMQWEPALVLARELAPDEVPIISMQNAQQLEYRGEYAKALEMYKKGHREEPSGHAGTELTAAKQAVQEHNEICLKGTARCLLRTGSVKEGKELAQKTQNAAFMSECAKILEDVKKYDDAANLYENAGDAERAVTLYIEQCKNLKAAGRLIHLITSSNIIVMYAKGKELEGSYKEAEKAYSQAKDWDNVVRIKVEKLNDLHGAYDIVRETRSVDAASMVAKMCTEKKEYGSAVEFLVLAKSISDAYSLAKTHNCMNSFEKALLSQVQLKDGIAPPQHQADFSLIASYYEQAKKPGQAALFYHIAGNFPLALKKYLEAGQPEDIEKAVEVVGQARTDVLANKLLDYLMGKSDEDAKESSYIFKLYMALGNFEKAAKTSTMIALREQEMGNYRSAHKTLVEAYRILRSKNMRVQNDLRRSLMLLHSYIIVKTLIDVLNDQEGAARMLLRVCRNIQKFPKHIPTILTSTVLQCIKADFKKSAFEISCKIIQSEKYRVELNDKNRKKIEGIVRRRAKDGEIDPPEASSPCIFCEAPVPDSELDCGACKNSLPFCIVSGKHIIKEDLCECPHCHFPARFSYFIRLLKETPTCPICDSMIDLSKVRKQEDLDIKAYA